MRILITGLDGFIGGYLNGRLNTQHQIFDLGCDLRDYDKVGERLQVVNPEIIIHLAAMTEVEKSFYEPIEFSEVNYTGTVNLIEKAKRLTNLKLFLFSSTMETYGWQPVSDYIRDSELPLIYSPPAFNELTQQNPNAPYAVAKLGCEKYLEYAHRTTGFPFCALRQTNSYGRHDNNFFVVEQIITQMLDNPKSIDLGYRKPFRNFLFIHDLIDLYETIVNNTEAATGHFFCTGPDNALSIESLVGMIANKLNWNGTINWDTKPKRDGEIYLLNSTNEKVTRIMGWEPSTDLSSGLDLTIQMWKK